MKTSEQEKAQNNLGYLTLEEQLVQACIEEEISTIQALLKLGADPNYLTMRSRNNWGNDYLKSPLNIICEYHGYNGDYVNAAKAAALLLQYGANINGGSDTSPLYDAIDQNAIPLVRVLLENGADIHQKIELGYTPLHVACGGFGSFASPETIDLMMQYGAIQDINVQSNEGKTPLHIAASYNEKAYPKEERLAAIEKLASLGADLGILDNENRSVLMLAENRNDLKQAIMDGIIASSLNTLNNDNPLVQQIKDALSEYGLNDISELAKPENQLIKISLMDNIIESHLVSIFPEHILEYKLHQACSDIDVNKINLLLNQGADPNFSELSKFAIDQQIAPLNVLANHWFDCSINAAMKTLLEHGANPNSIDLKGNTALHTICESIFTPLDCKAANTSLLLNHSADLNIQNLNGDTPSHILLASIQFAEEKLIHESWSTELIEGNYHFLNKLHEAGADFSIPNNQGATVMQLLLDPLHIEDSINHKGKFPTGTESNKILFDDVITKNESLFQNESKTQILETSTSTPQSSLYVTIPSFGLSLDQPEVE